MPFTFLGRVRLELEGGLSSEQTTAKDIWCHETLSDFQTAVHNLKGYIWKDAAEPMMPGKECASFVSKLTPKERERLDELIRKEPHPSFEPLKE